MKRWFIGDIAKRFGLNPRTIRYYAKIGILPETGRSESGYRIYSDAAVDRLAFILKAKSLGLKLDEIKEILNLYDQGVIPCERTRSFLGTKIIEIERKIEDLTELKKKLQNILKVERQPVFNSICPIISESDK